jgi:Xaa-Pro aminopeptidase
MGLESYGTMGVDWEERVDHGRLRRERLERLKGLLAESQVGAVVCFDMANIRYVTATHIGTWAADKLGRFCLLPQGDLPIMWDFGSAARHHDLHSPWFDGGRSRAGISTMRGAFSPNMGRAQDVARKIRAELEERGLMGEPLGVDVVEPAVLFALQAEGIDVVDGQQLLQESRKIKNEEAAFALQFGHGIGLSIWEKPMFSRLASLDHPETIEEGMVFALETFWPSSDGWSAARIEEQLVVTAEGCEVITRFPAEELLVAGRRYHTVGGELPGRREIESHRNSGRELPVASNGAAPVVQ